MGSPDNVETIEYHHSVLVTNPYEALILNVTELQKDSIDHQQLHNGAQLFNSGGVIAASEVEIPNSDSEGDGFNTANAP